MYLLELLLLSLVSMVQRFHLLEHRIGLPPLISTST